MKSGICAWCVLPDYWWQGASSRSFFLFTGLLSLLSFLIQNYATSRSLPTSTYVCGMEGERPRGGRAWAHTFSLSSHLTPFSRIQTRPLSYAPDIPRHHHGADRRRVIHCVPPLRLPLGGRRRDVSRAHHWRRHVRSVWGTCRVPA